MAIWQVPFHMVPRSALTTVSRPLSPQALEDHAWWLGASFPADYPRLIGAFLAPGVSADPDRETWGAEEGNRIDVWRAGGQVRAAIVYVDVRKLDSTFGAAVLIFLRAADAILIRRDGLIVEPTIAGYSAALRSSSAWQHASDPYTWIAAQKARGEDVE